MPTNLRVNAEEKENKRVCFPRLFVPRVLNKVNVWAIVCTASRQGDGNEFGISSFDLYNAATALREKDYC